MLNRSNSDGGQENIFVHLTSLLSDNEIESLYVELVREFEACMLGYFSFHWDHSSAIIDQSNEDSEDKECFFNFNGTAEGHW